jgi:hypothetical protein
MPFDKIVKREAGEERNAMLKLTRSFQEPFSPEPQVAAWAYVPAQGSAEMPDSCNYTVTTAAPSNVYNAAQIGH